MDNNEKKKLIKSLLAGKLTKLQRKEFADLNPVDKELKNQWDESGDRIVDESIKEEIWGKVKSRCEQKISDKMRIEPMWYFAAASIALLIAIGGFWFNSREGLTQDELIKVTARQSRTYILPDSTKVWMEAGSAIQYAKGFTHNRKVWLEGNSLFEVTRREKNPFIVYIDKAFIEVKGTCFLVKQNDAETSEITLFHGKIEFNVESTGEKMIMKPYQRMIFNPENAQMRVERIANIRWENGKYNFTDIPLQELVGTINQMYGSNITLAADISHESAFTGSIRYDEPLEDVIDKICFSLNLRQEKNVNGITIKN